MTSLTKNEDDMNNMMIESSESESDDESESSSESESESSGNEGSESENGETVEWSSEKEEVEGQPQLVVSSGKTDTDTDTDMSMNKKAIDAIDDVNSVNASAGIAADDANELNSVLQKTSKCVARNPCLFLWIAMMISIGLSLVGLIVGEFAVEVESEGWWSRGTLQANRQMQMTLVIAKSNALLNSEDDSVWNDLLLNNQAGFDVLLSGDESMTAAVENQDELDKDRFEEDDTKDDIELRREQRQRHRFLSSSIIAQLLQEKQEREQQEQKRRLDPNDGSLSVIAGCELSFYSQLPTSSLWPVWKIKEGTKNNNDKRSVLDSDVLREICIAETKTQQYLEENNLCNKNRGCTTINNNNNQDQDGSRCLPPYSIVLYARLILDNGFDAHDTNGGFDMNCDELAMAWTSELQTSVTKTWMKRLSTLREDSIISDGGTNNEDGGSDVDIDLDEQYPYGYYPALVDTDFVTTGISKYTSSIFDTSNLGKSSDLYDMNENFDRGNLDIIEGSYDNGYESFVNIKVDSMLVNDMALALASSAIIAIAIMLHTQSPLITGVGLLQIVLSFPLAFFAYKLILGLKFFPFLNFIGIFVVFALGAGDIYVAFDKWTNYRRENLNKSTEYVAALALPESLYAMFLTTLTTTIAFFASAICPVAPIKMFAIFCGLLIIFDYVLTVAFIFPALCIYDKALIKRIKRQNQNNNNTNNRSIITCLWASWLGCVSCGTCCRRSKGGKCSCCTKTDVYNSVVVIMGDHNHQTNSDNNGDYYDDDDGDSTEVDPKNKNIEEEGFVDESLNNTGIPHEGGADADATTTTSTKFNFEQRVMLGLTHYLRLLRWPLFILCVVAFGLCCYFATTLKLPENSDVRLLSPNNEFEKAAEWRKSLLSTELEKLGGGSKVSIIWGVLPADTGDHTDPSSGTKLLLDDTFEPSSAEAQKYLLSFCDELFQQEFASPLDGNYACSMERFDQWLLEQSTAENPDLEYITMCGGASRVPVPEDQFHDCISNWARKEQETSVLSRDGVVQTMIVSFMNKALFTDPFEVLDEQMNMIEDWLVAKSEIAPSGVDQSFFAGGTFYWHDTNGSMMNTAYSGAGIALGASAAIILLSSKSISMTVFATITILYILTSVTSMLSAIGWTLGFIESVCFSILIGVSVDFIIHFAHAYVLPAGDKPREERTKYAMVSMGPSILATALTTFASAVVMLFCTITFFQKFGTILLFTIIQATLGSFIFFMTLTNCFGPTDPTKLVNKCFKMCGKKENR